MSSDHPAPTRLPLAQCRLDRSGLSVQLDRYRALGRHVDSVERRPRRLEVRFGAGVDAGVLADAIAVERECCPFFHLSYEPVPRRLSVSVSDDGQDTALDALRFALTSS